MYVTRAEMGQVDTVQAYIRRLASRTSRQGLDMRHLHTTAIIQDSGYRGLDC